MSKDHRFLKAVLTQRAFERVKNETRQWLIECPCGFKQDFWDAGGLRSKGSGRPRQLTFCPRCEKPTWQTVRRKTSETEVSVSA